MVKHTRHMVLVYDIERDRKRLIEFDNWDAAEAYAKKLKNFLLNRPNPAPVFIDVMPV